MTPAAFIAKWIKSELRERQGAQEHFIDLCRLIGEPTPAEADPAGGTYCFERGATKVGGGDGWADVWRRGCFGWEYKGKHKDLNAALRQLQALYSLLHMRHGQKLRALADRRLIDFRCRPRHSAALVAICSTMPEQGLDTGG